jgi:hypothetical protein
MDSTIAALLGAVIGGALSVLASWLAQRVQSKSQWVTQEIKQRQELYSQFVEAASCCFADAMLESEPDTARLAMLYGAKGRMRLVSSAPVINEANRILHKILETFADRNRSKAEARDFLDRDSFDLFADFGDACRAELVRLQPLRAGLEAPLAVWPTQSSDAASSS